MLHGQASMLGPVAPMPAYSVQNVDLHSHSIVSDGQLSPAELMARAHARGVTLMSLTDHDAVDGLAEARAAASRLGMGFVDGVEISVSWEGVTLHLVGLRFDPAHPALAAGLHTIREGRAERARRIAASLERVGIPGALEGAYAYCGNPHLIGRTHFARFLHAQGHAPSMREVFRRFLTPGKPGYVEHRWAEFEHAMNWILASGGVPVLAHPGRYPIGDARMRTLLGVFKDLGGVAIEVMTGSHRPDQFTSFGAHARRYGFLASRGADFHGPDEGPYDLGELPPLPHDLKPVWHDWPEVQLGLAA
jgi:predicted metal-dependent phosphoesterase TrpH